MNKRIIVCLMVAATGLLCCLWGTHVTAATIYDSPFVTFSPDRQAWTTCAGDKNSQHYSYGATAVTGTASTLGALGNGQHYYQYVRSGRVPVSKWVVEWPDARCIHNNYTDNNSFHGVIFGKNRCLRDYNSGWIAYCADCNQSVTRMFVYMTRQAAETIGYVEVGGKYAYYFCCPHCNNLEQGAYWGTHTCRQISWNQYQVRYDANTSSDVSGYMAPSYHMYNNAGNYEGKKVTAVTGLSANQYKREGYEFLGWNTKADGSGTFYENGAEILNLTTYDYYRDGRAGTVTLYAQWVEQQQKVDLQGLIHTRKLQTSPGENVYYVKEKDLYYVKADGKTPFTLTYEAYLDVAASGYQPNYVVLETISSGVSARNIIYVPDTKEVKDQTRVNADTLGFSAEGTGLLERCEDVVIYRKDQGREIEAVQDFLLKKELSGVQMKVLPIAGVTADKDIVYSDYQEDQQNGITLVADGEAPEIRGMESLESLQVIDRDAGEVLVKISASDALSGIGDFYVQVTNKDNQLERTYRPGAGGTISLSITQEEMLFAGDFVITAYAKDRVGNVTELSYDTTEFALKVELQRILEPHDPIFKRGESGILHITAIGYAERVEVEFPEELAIINPELNKTFVYTDNPEYQKEEQLQFMIPLDAPENAEYTITVRAYKGDSRLEEFPDLAVLEVNGSILDDLRTRLR